jgi:hypothetical protein
MDRRVWRKTMRSRWWYLLGLAAVPLALGLSMHAADADMGRAVIQFNDPGRVVTLTIPTPPCRPDGNTIACQWELEVDEPNVPGQPVVGTAFGTSGVLSIPYPSYCGVIQADAVVGPPPRREVGYQHQINTCVCPSNSQVGLTSLITRPPSGGGTTGPDELALFLGLVVVAGALGRRRTTHPR